MKNMRKRDAKAQDKEHASRIHMFEQLMKINCQWAKRNVTIEEYETLIQNHTEYFYRFELFYYFSTDEVFGPSSKDENFKPTSIIYG